MGIERHGVRVISHLQGLGGRGRYRDPADNNGDGGNGDQANRFDFHISPPLVCYSDSALSAAIPFGTRRKKPRHLHPRAPIIGTRPMT